MGDASQALSIIGYSCKLFNDQRKINPNTFLSAYNGDSENLIDRFDVVNYMDFIPEYYQRGPRKLDKGLECFLNYERYRSLIEAKRFNIDEQIIIQKAALESKNKSLQGFGMKRSLYDNPDLECLNNTNADPTLVNKEVEDYGISLNKYGYNYTDILSYDREELQLELNKKQDNQDHEDIVLTSKGTTVNK